MVELNNYTKGQVRTHEPTSRLSEKKLDLKWVSSVFEETWREILALCASNPEATVAYIESLDSQISEEIKSR